MTRQKARTRRRPASRVVEPEVSPAGQRAVATFDEERREVLASVLLSLAVEAPDPDRKAACVHLLRHLAQTDWAARPLI
jgi:hypothetical protein